MIDKDSEISAVEDIAEFQTSVTDSITMLLLASIGVILAITVMLVMGGSIYVSSKKYPEVWTDKETSCQYVVANNGIFPRVDGDFNQLGCKRKQRIIAGKM